MNRATVLEVESTSTPGKTYRVWVDSAGPVFCDCPAHKFSRGKPAEERPDCKHMRSVRGSPACEPAMALALGRSERGIPPLASGAGGTYTFDRRIRFIEMQEETDSGSWVTVGDLSRFNQLEV